VTRQATARITHVDPLRAHTALPFHHVLFPYGFPVHVKSNNPAIIRAAELSWASFKQSFREEPIELRFVISEIPTRRRSPCPVFRAQSHLLVAIADDHNFACCDLLEGFAFAFLTQAAASNRDYVRYHFLEALAYTLLDTKHVVAVHSACVAKKDRGVLLVGDSGAGKSSLAYACARSGWTYISDDASCILRRKSGRRVLGNPQTFRFRPSIAALFPELMGPVKARNGKPTIEIKTEKLPRIQTAYSCHADYIVFLNRHENAADTALSPISREEALSKLLQTVWPAELPIHEERFEAVERLIAAECYRLSYSEFGPAIELLERLVSGGVV